MVIQCSSCNTKYRLNLERIPNRKTFVKCKNCGTPIYIDAPESDEAAEQPVQAGKEAGTRQTPAPSPSGAPSTDRAVVACVHCGTRYRVPSAALDRPGVKLKCSHCGHTFAPPTAAAAPPPSREEKPAAGPEPGPEFYPAPRPGEDGPSGGERAVPVPDQSAIEGMLDDFREQASPFEQTLGTDPAEEAAAEPPAEEGEPAAGESSAAMETEIAPAPGAGAEPAPAGRGGGSETDPDQAYLEATSFDDGDLHLGESKLGTIPDESKYKFFLKPVRPAEGQSLQPSQAESSAAPAAGVDAELDALLEADSPKAAPGDAGDLGGERTAGMTPSAAAPSPEPSRAPGEDLNLVADSLEADEAAAPTDSGELLDDTAQDISLPETGWNSMAGSPSDSERAPLSVVTMPGVERMLPWFLLLLIVLTFALLISTGGVAPSMYPSVQVPQGGGRELSGASAAPIAPA